MVEKRKRAYQMEYNETEGMGAVPAEVEKSTAVEKCPACGADMIFDAESGCLLCEHCGTKKQIVGKSSEEQDFERLLNEKGDWGSESHVFRCQNCGAQEVLDKKEIAKACPFCGATNIVKTDELPGIRPNAVVPFFVTLQQAGSSVRHWVRKRLLAPQKFRKSAKPEKMNAVYLPAFTFDSQTESYYSAVLGKYYYVTRRVNGRTVQERRIKYFNVSGSYCMFFDDVLVQASSTVGEDNLKKLRPFDTGNSKEYSPEYLSGYTATQKTRTGLACWEDAKKEIGERLKGAILGQYTYDVVSSFRISTQYYNITYKYVLLPVYVGHCKWHQKVYNFFVNGLNAKVTGKAPVSPLKVSILVVLGIAVVVGLYFLYRYMS